jgi:hypothetical protein
MAVEDVAGLASLSVRPLALSSPQPTGVAIDRGLVELDFHLAKTTTP